MRLRSFVRCFVAERRSVRVVSHDSAQRRRRVSARSDLRHAQSLYRRRKTTWLSAHYEGCDDSVAKQTLQWMPHGHRDREHLGKRSGGDVDSRIQVELKEGGGGSTEQS